MTRGHRIAVVAALTLGAALVLGACSSDKKVDTAASNSSSTASSAPVNVNSGPTVDVVEFSFTPGDEAVKVGDTVTWKNNGNSKHTVTPKPLADGSVPWVSSQIEPTETFVQTFSEPGTYSYFCSIHPDRMAGTVTVTAN
jgi:plastocyanin